MYSASSRSEVVLASASTLKIKTTVAPEGGGGGGEQQRHSSSSRSSSKSKLWRWLQVMMHQRLMIPSSFLLLLFVLLVLLGFFSSKSSLPLLKQQLLLTTTTPAAAATDAVLSSSSSNKLVQQQQEKSRNLRANNNNASSLKEGPQQPQPQQQLLPQQQQQKKVIIVGAGAAGLSAARELNNKKYYVAGGGDGDDNDDDGSSNNNNNNNIVILEASHVFGGRVRKDDRTGTGFSPDFPVDLGATFVHRPKENLIDRKQFKMLPIPGLDGRNDKIFVNYTWYDYIANYVAPSPSENDDDDNIIVYGCQVIRIDYSNSSTTSVGGATNVVCRDNRTYVAEHAVIVTVPLSVLKDGDIKFTPPLPESITVNHPARMWEGFKIFLEFTEKFYPPGFCGPYYCEEDYGEMVFWDYSYIHKHSNRNIIAGYIVGDPAVEYVKLDDDQIVEKVLKLLDSMSDGTASKYYNGRNLVMNWSKEPYIRGTYSSTRVWFDQTGAINIKNKVYIAGEAFPIEGDENGWVHSAMHSGVDAAKKIIYRYYPEEEGEG